MPSFLTKPVLFTVDAIDKLKNGRALSECSPISAVRRTELPILFIHGAQDSFILPKNSEDMARRTAGYSELRLIPGAGHAESVLTAPEDYKAYMTGFLNKILPDSWAKV